MAYYINGKAFTDHPLMDEIVYNCKLILRGIVVKNDILANNSETDNSINNAEMLFLQIDTGQDIPFDVFIFSEEILLSFGYTQEQVDLYLRDRNQIPVEDRDELTAFANEYFRETFEEENDYYRMLNGLPPFDSGENYYIWLTSSDIPSDYTKEVDFSLPLHKQPNDLINVLYSDNVIEKLRKIYPGSDYSYMNYLGDKKISIYEARKASKWDILYIPNIYYMIRDKFIEFYKINRETYMNRSYQDYFSQTGEYYDQMMILIVLCQTFADMVTDVPEWYIRRDIFDIKSCKYFLESAGVAYFKEIPLKYQIRIVKNLNRLIQNKSSNQNLDDILDIFSINNTYIYKYWLYKKPEKDGNFSLEFIASGYKESYDDYIKDTKYRYPYESITLQDKYWNGEFDQDQIYDRILEQDFTIQGTKYMSVNYQIDLSEYLYQLEYILGLILDSNTQESLSEIKFGIPSINETALFRLSDIFLFLIILSNEFYQWDSVVKFPDDISDGPEPEINEDQYDWLKRIFPEAFVLKNGRVYGFNSDLNKEELLDSIRYGRHSKLRFGSNDYIYKGVPLNKEEYRIKAQEWIDELQIDQFIVPKDIPDIDTLVGIYDTNTKIYHKVKDAIVNAPDRDEKKLLEYVFQELFTRKYDIDFYKYVDSEGEEHIYNNLVDIIKDRDFILYELYLSVTTESNIETKKDLLRTIMGDILDTLEYYLSSDGYKYLYSFVAVNSPASIVKYLYLMFNFFKSYKVYFLDPSYTLLSNDQLENNVYPIDRISHEHFTIPKWDAVKTEDYIPYINKECWFVDEYNNSQVVDIYAYYDPDPFMDRDFDGIHAEDGEQVTEEIDGGYADDASAAPYINANGGAAYLCDLNLSDINGGEARESISDYYEIDAGYAYDPDFMKTDAMGSQQFNYEIDGGGADKRRFISNNIDIDFIGTEFVANVRLSDKNRSIEIKEDGLYISIDAVVTEVNFEALKTVFDEAVSEVFNNIMPLEDSIKIIIDEANSNIIYISNSMTDNIIYAVNMNTDNAYFNKLKNFTDGLISYLYEEFNEQRINPYYVGEI